MSDVAPKLRTVVALLLLVGCTEVSTTRPIEEQAHAADWYKIAGGSYIADIRLDDGTRCVVARSGVYGGATVAIDCDWAGLRPESQP